ncbi:MAG: hypothetical protein P4L59_15500 [Desulfosporosinus sp.]|nr:hypothetical protein [Desulfosporosinus sp.]
MGSIGATLVNTNLPGKFGLGIHSLDATGNQGGVIDQFASPLSLSFQNSQISDISLSTATNLLYFQ